MNAVDARLQRIAYLYYINALRNEMQIMTAATLSFRAPSEFAEQTKALAKAMTSSDYVREAVREKNERTMRSLMVLSFFSRTASRT